MARRVQLFIATSLDQKIARRDGGIDWLFTDQDYGYDDFYAGVETLLMGRKTFDVCHSFGDWPYLGKRTIVFSRRPAPARLPPKVDWTSADPVELVRASAAGHGGSLWLVGGESLTTALVRADLVDDLVLSVHPIVLGRGIPLWDGDLGRTTRWSLARHEVYPSQLVQLWYARARG